MASNAGPDEAGASLPLYPEASPEASLIVWREIEARLPVPSEPRGEALAELRANPIPLREEARWPGAAAPADSLERLANEIHLAAEACGFPDRAAPAGLRAFDARVKTLIAGLDLTPAQAMSGRGGMFRWISMGLVQAVGPWRFPEAFDASKNTDARRLRNPYQDIIGRLWWQHRFFGDRDVSQDLIETILGRPGSLGSDTRVAGSFVEFLTADGITSEDERRETAKRMRILAAWMSLTELDDDALHRVFRMLADFNTPLPDIVTWTTNLARADDEPPRRVVRHDEPIEIVDPVDAGRAISAFRARQPGSLQVSALAEMLGIDEAMLTEMERGTCGTTTMAPAARRLIAFGCDFGESLRRTES